MSPGFSAFRSNEGASGGGGSTRSSGPSTSSVRAVDVALAGTAAAGAGCTTGVGPRAGARGGGAIDGPGAGSGVVDGAGVENVCDAPKRPVIDVRPSSFCIALLTARITVSSAPT